MGDNMLFFYLFASLLLATVILIIELTSVLIFNIYYRAKINNLLESVNTREDLLFMRFNDFLNLTAEVFRRKGHKVRITDKCGEEGKGLILDDRQFVEIWKHSLHHMVEVETAMKLAKCMQVNSIYRGMLISLGDFKYNTKAYCHANVIECINGEQLVQMCKEVQRKNMALESS